jgi:hypothetical protein
MWHHLLLDSRNIDDGCDPASSVSGRLKRHVSGHPLPTNGGLIVSETAVDRLLDLTASHGVITTLRRANFFAESCGTVKVTVS